MGSVWAGAKVIQIALDGVKQRVDQGMSFEEATAMVMNHELVHACVLWTCSQQEFSLLERLTRQYESLGPTRHAQWAVSTYATRKDPETGQEVPQDAVIQQEEAIAEMLSDAMTKGVLIDGNVRKIGGSPRLLSSESSTSSRGWSVTPGTTTLTTSNLLTGFRPERSGPESVVLFGP